MMNTKKTLAVCLLTGAILSANACYLSAQAGEMSASYETAWISRTSTNYDYTMSVTSYPATTTMRSKYLYGATTPGLSDLWGHYYFGTTANSYYKHMDLEIDGMYPYPNNCSYGVSGISCETTYSISANQRVDYHGYTTLNSASGSKYYSVTRAITFY